MLDLVGNLEDRFSHNEAHIYYKHIVVNPELRCTAVLYLYCVHCNTSNKYSIAHYSIMTRSTQSMSSKQELYIEKIVEISSFIVVFEALIVLL